MLESAAILAGVLSVKSAQMPLRPAPDGPPVRADAPAHRHPENPPERSTNRRRSPAPTGLSSAEQNPQAPRELIAAARAIRAALDESSKLRHAKVRVLPGPHSVVVEGTVGSEQEKGAVEYQADRASQGANLDFFLNVRPIK